MTDNESDDDDDEKRNTDNVSDDDALSGHRLQYHHRLKLKQH